MKVPHPHQFYILVPANPPSLSSMGPVLVMKNATSFEVHHLLPYHCSATSISPEQGAAGLRQWYS